MWSRPSGRSPWPICRPADLGPARRQPAVPGGPGLGLRRLGRRQGHRPLERARTLRLGRRHRDGGAHHPVHRGGHHLAQPAGDGRADPARPDAGLLAARRERLTPGGRGRWVSGRDRRPADRPPGTSRGSRPNLIRFTLKMSNPRADVMARSIAAELTAFGLAVQVVVPGTTVVLGHCSFGGAGLLRRNAATCVRCDGPKRSSRPGRFACRPTTGSCKKQALRVLAGLAGVDPPANLPAVEGDQWLNQGRGRDDLRGSTLAGREPCSPASSNKMRSASRDTPSFPTSVRTLVK